MKLIKLIIAVIATTAFISVALGGVNAMNIFNNDFEQKWEALSKNVKKLNEYTAVHPVVLRNVKVSERNIDGAIFTGAKFVDVEWENSTSKNSTFTKVLFEKCKFIQSNFSNSTFIDVVFKDCEFIDADINKSKLIDVRFESCNFNQMGLVKNEGNTLTLVNCHMLDSGMGDCTIDFEIKDCTLDGVDVSTSKGGRKVDIEGGLLSEVDFGDSHFSTVTLRRVRQGEGPAKFNGSTARSFRFEDVDMTRGVSLAHVTAESVVIEGGTFRGATEGSAIARIYAHNSNLFMYDMSEAKMPYVNISNCEIQDLAIWECFIDELSICNSTIHGIDATDFKAHTVVWDNVTLDGKIDLTNAHIKDFRPTRLKRGPRLQLITTGSNVQF